MLTERGKQMTAALTAVAQMHSDSSRLLRDLDAYMDGYKSVYGSFATSDLSYDVKKGFYMAEGLLRHYFHPDTPTDVIAVNIAFYDSKAKLMEPIIIVAKIRYIAPLGAVASRDNVWDPWSAYLYWNERREYGEIMQFPFPKRKETLEQIAVIAEPLLSIESEKQVRALIDIVRQLPF